jgi:WD40 repeat protein
MVQGPDLAVCAGSLKVAAVITRRFLRISAAVIGAGALLAGVLVVTGLLGRLRASGPDRLQRVIDRYGFPVGGLAFSPDGMLLAVASAGGRGQVWNLASDRRVAQIDVGRNEDLTSVNFGPGGRSLIFTGDYPGVRVYAAGSWRMLPLRFRLSQRYTGLAAATTDADGGILAGVGNDSNFYLFLTGSARRVRELPESSSYAFALSPDGRTIALAARRIRLLSVRTGRIEAVFDQPGHHHVQDVEYSADGATIATTDGRAIYLWDAATRQLSKTIEVPPDLYLRELALNPDGLTIAGLDATGGVCIFSLRTGRLDTVLPDQNGNQATVVAFSPSGTELAVGDMGGRVALWNVAGLT